MGAFGALEPGMTLSKAQELQPALQHFGGMSGTPIKSHDGKLRLYSGCALHRAMMENKDAFPWSWGDESPNVNAYVECTGEVLKKDAYFHDDKNEVILGDFIMNLYNSQTYHANIGAWLKNEWGDPIKVSYREFSEQTSVQLWRNPLSKTCVLLSGHSAGAFF